MIANRAWTNMSMIAIRAWMNMPVTAISARRAGKDMPMTALGARKTMLASLITIQGWMDMPLPRQTPERRRVKGGKALRPHGGESMVARYSAPLQHDRAAAAVPARPRHRLRCPVHVVPEALARRRMEAVGRQHSLFARRLRGALRSR